jgi:hypothetical protein
MSSRLAETTNPTYRTEIDLANMSIVQHEQGCATRLVVFLIDKQARYMHQQERV